VVKCHTEGIEETFAAQDGSYSQVLHEACHDLNAPVVFNEEADLMEINWFTNAANDAAELTFLPPRDIESDPLTNLCPE
jgi:hypothetical protein